MTTSFIDAFIDYEALKGHVHDTMRVKRKNITAFFDFIGCDAGMVDTDAIVRYVDRLKGKGISDIKINLSLTHLSQFYAFLMMTDRALVNPVESVERLKESSPDHLCIFSEDEIRALLNVTLNHFKRRKSTPIMLRDRAILELLYSTGMRLSEVLHLDIDDIDVTKREIHIFNAKGDVERVIPVGDEALKAVDEYLEERDGLLKPEREYDALFISRQGNRLAGVSLRRMIHRRKKEAGIVTRGTTHAFRRSFASHLLAHGAPLAVLSRMLGHRHLDTTQKYTLIDDDEAHIRHTETHPAGR